jgi:hypothetical protein
MSYAIPTKELTLTDIKQFKLEAIAAGIRTAEASGIGNGGVLQPDGSRKGSNLTVREAHPFIDFGAPAGVGWTTDWYRGPAIVGAAWGSVFNSGAVPAFAPTLARTKVAVFYKFQDSTAPAVITAVRFRVGATGASTLASFFIQLPTQGNLEPDVFFSEPVVYMPEDVVYIEAYYNAPIGAAAEVFAFGCFIIERIGGVIS